MNPWQLIDSQAQLHVEGFRGRVDLSRPADGLHELHWRERSFNGSLLGVTATEGAAQKRALVTTGMEHFVRGKDLVANFPQSESQPFTVQIYWRITTAEADMVVLDAIVSLQTSLLECYPKAILTTRLSAEEVCIVCPEEAEVIQLRDWASSDYAGILLRAAGVGCSYLELTHPEDLGSWRIGGENSIEIIRELGGEFQEKGVIRRLRVRAAFLPKENDLSIARRLMAQFADSPPPLTA